MRRPRRCDRCNKLSLDVWECWVGGERIQHLCPGCVATRRGMGVRVEVRT